MADKKITELQLISAPTDGLSLPADNGTQTYRTTALQIYNFFKSKTWLATNQLKTSAYTVASGDSVVIGDTTGGTFAITLHTAVGYTGKIVRIVKKNTGIALAINTTSAQTVGGRASGVTKLWVAGDWIDVMSNGTNWDILSIKESLGFYVKHGSGLTLPNDTEATGNTVILDEDVQYNYGEMYDDTTGIITAPVDGLWFFAAELMSATSLNSSFHWEMVAIRDPGGADEAIAKDWYAGNGSANTVEAIKISGQIKLAAGETMSFDAAGVGQTMDLASSPNFSYFNMWKIG